MDRSWQRLILTHLAEKTHLGVLTGAPITDMKITLAAGRAHIKHTEGGDFREATYRAVLSRDELVDVFLSLADEGVSILFSTHITEDLDKCADDVSYIRNGEIVFSLPLAELRKKYRTVELTAEQAERCSKSPRP